MSGAGGDGDGVTGQKADKSVTSTFVSVKPLDVFKETLWEFPAAFVGTETKYFWREVRTYPAVFVETNTGIKSQNLIFLWF